MLPNRFRKRMFPDFVDDFFGNDLISDFFTKHTGTETPAVNIIEEKNKFKVEVAAPGLEKEDFKIDLNNNILTVYSEKEKKEEEENEKFMRREFCFTCFKRSFSLPDTVDSEKITASHKNGVLYIDIPKKEETKEKGKRSISIE